MRFESRNTKICAIKEYPLDGQLTTITEIAGEMIPAMMESLQWNMNEISIVLVVTQTPDIYLPSTAFCVQKELGMGTECMVYDINHGANGFATAYQVIDSMFACLPAEGKALCICGDISESCKTVAVVAMEKCENREVNLVSKILPDSYQDIYQLRSEDSVVKQEDSEAIRERLHELHEEIGTCEVYYSNLELKGNEDAYRYSSAWIPHIINAHKEDSSELLILSYGAGVEALAMKICTDW